MTATLEDVAVAVLAVEAMRPTIYAAAKAFERGEGVPVVAVRDGHRMPARLWRGWVQVVSHGGICGAGLFSEVRYA